MKRRDFAIGVTPSLIMMVALLAVPLVYSIVWSFQSVQYGTPGEWIGFDNYQRVLTDSTFHTAVFFTVGFAVVHTVLALALGYGLALLMHRARRGKSLFLGILLTPYVIPAVIGATAFSWLFDDSFGGLVNLGIESLTGQTVQWFTSTWPNRTLVLMAATWASLPFMMLVFLGALKGVPEEQLEAATIDGANWWQRQWHVVIPMLGPMVRFLTLTSIMGGLGLFDALIPLAPNAQAVGSQSVNLYVFQNAFARDQQNLGLGSAVNILMLLVMFVLIAPFVRQVYREVKEGS
ncbi:carbohydrate ABC transporter permease [Nocardioides panzhihuensis]|uniref:Multiple sugar transport system permease protein/N,N'-diacetylchitobiose transport system permease protein n=1 Tax=Nocardioides panzhihuensis TaxID=860243 RepID=A0A7Z0ITF7_9ACTN|nr:sugar ABC transporter permease [Nocardioides panzhihuensis]NYI78906.1 multiple sugar transport system permease protein/N,N'-diacetylchitobiose transport system permease protein [Nocardioides panzhihuensis]